jgi:hypothetical protein
LGKGESLNKTSATHYESDHHADAFRNASTIVRGITLSDAQTERLPEEPVARYRTGLRMQTNSVGHGILACRGLLGPGKSEKFDATKTRKLIRILPVYRRT